jgi:hypothetical protein
MMEAQSTALQRKTNMYGECNLVPLLVLSGRHLLRHRRRLRTYQIVRCEVNNCPEDDSKVLLRNGMTGGDCLGFFDSSNNPLPECGRGSFGSYRTPHWQPRYNEVNHPPPHAAVLSWTKAGAYARFNVPRGQRNLTSLDWVDVRVAIDPDSDAVRLELLVVDGQGHDAILPTSLMTVDGWPGEYDLDRVHARALRGSLASVRSSNKVNLSNIVAVLLVARSAIGRIWVIDIAASQARIQQPVVLNLPVISVETLIAPEGNGLNSVNVKITADQPLKSPGSIWVSRGYNTGFRVDLDSGSSTTVAQIPFEFIGDKFYSMGTFSETLAVGAIRGVVTGNYLGSITVVDDDPVPTLSVVAQSVTAVEGKSLTWRFRLSAPTTGTSVWFCIESPTKGNELSSSDVPASWLQQSYVSPPFQPVPLSTLNMYLTVDFDYGATSGSLIMPIVVDTLAENDESVVFAGYDLQGQRLTLVGTVPKHG